MSEEFIEAWDGEIVIMPTRDGRMMLSCSCGWDRSIDGSPMLETINHIAVEHWKETHDR